MLVGVGDWAGPGAHGTYEPTALIGAVSVKGLRVDTHPSRPAGAVSGHHDNTSAPNGRTSWDLRVELLLPCRPHRPWGRHARKGTGTRTVDVHIIDRGPRLFCTAQGPARTMLAAAAIYYS